MWASALAYVVAQMAVVLLHEGAHTITGVLQGLRAIQFTGEVRFDPDPGGLTLVWRALAGPLFSLASGALLALMRPWHGDGFGRLLTTWFAFLSMQEGLGYLIVAPVLRAGDTGAALAELNAPWIAYAASVAVGVAGMFWLASRCAIEGVELTRDLYEMRAFCVWGWLIGTAGSLVLAAAALALTPGTDGGGRCRHHGRGINAWGLRPHGHAVLGSSGPGSIHGPAGDCHHSPVGLGSPGRRHRP